MKAYAIVMNDEIKFIVTTDHPENIVLKENQSMHPVPLGSTPASLIWDPSTQTCSKRARNKEMKIS